MSLFRLLMSIALPVLFWLLCGGVALVEPNTAVLMALATLFIWNMLWQPALCRLLTADRFTYGVVFATVTSVITLISLGLIWRSIFALRFELTRGLFSIGTITLAFLLVAFIATWLLPVMTARRQPRLPQQSERRELETPQ